MALASRGGSLVKRGASLGSGEACCCGGGGQPCDPCSVYNQFSFPSIPFPYSRMVGTWDTGSGPVEFDWLAPAGQQYTGYINRGWENNSRPPVGMALSAPDTLVHATVWRWDGSTETCNTYGDDGIEEAEVPALRTCGGAACSAWFYNNGVNAVMTPREYRTLIANPPPSDNQWYTFLYIQSGVGGAAVWYWAWIPACARTCGEEVTLSSDGPFPDALTIDTFTLTCEWGAPCCTGNNAYPTFELPSSCTGHGRVGYAAQTTPNGRPLCLGACCYNNGTAEVCGGSMVKAQCDSLGGTWHSGKSCAPDYQNVTLSFSSAAFGSGGGGMATAPVGTPGPITAVSITNPGSGYARVVRVVPTVAASVAGGTGATFTPSMVSNGGTPQTWRVGSVAIAGAGTGYTDGTSVAFSTGDIEQTAAVGTLRTTRSQPSLTASATGGTGATFTVSTTGNGGSPQTWGVSGVSVSGTTSGYTDGASISFGYGAGVTQQTKATATIRTARTEPTITASAAGGSGATLAVTLSQSPTSPSDTALWHVAGVSVTAGGTGYTDGDPVTFTVTDGTQATAATGTVVCGRENPNLTPYVFGMYDGTPTTGTGASLSATMEPNGDEWTVASITILNGGSGYQVGEFIWYYELAEFGDNPPYYIVAFDGYWITSVDENGAITGIGLDPDIGGTGLFYKASDSIASVTVTAAGDYYKSTSTISRVVVTNPGAYYYDTGVPASVTITSGGSYYREEVSVAPVTVTITQGIPASGAFGTGASITATVDSDRYSGTFGKVTALTITNGGSGYVAVVPADDPCNLFP